MGSGNPDLGKITKLCETSLFLKWSDTLATEKQKNLLRKLEVSFDPTLSKGDAFLLIRKQLNKPKQMEMK